MDPLLDFSDHVVLITGAAGGFGALLAQEFSQRGAKLVLGDIDESGVEHTASSLPGAAAAMACDVSNPEHCAAMVEAALELYEQLDIAINNAGVVQPFTRLHETKPEELERQFAINVNGVFYGMQYQAKAMMERESGHILNVASLAGINGAPKLAAYGAAKHAVVGATRSAAVEYARWGVRVNAICPFYAMTDMVTKDLAAGDSSDDIENQLGRGAPMRRLAQPQEVVNTMLLMCSPGNSFMTGQAIAVDGGVSAI